MPPPSDIGLVGVISVLLAALFAPPLAAVIAPYIATIIGALMGAGWGLKRRHTTSRWDAVFFIVLMVGTALIFTVPAAMWLQRYTGENTAQWFLAPIAALIGAVGEDWPKVGTWAAGVVRKWVLFWATNNRPKD